MYRGGCLCGDIAFEITGKIHDIVYCHCSQCRKAQGSAFATNGWVHESDFRLTKGENALTGYASSPGQVKYFCRRCGSPIMSRNTAKPGIVRVRLGTIESPISERPGAHIFVGSKTEWDSITDNLPQYDAFPPA